MPLEIDDGEPPVEWVSAEYLRKVFNESLIAEKADANELITQITRSSHPNPPPNDEPFCTNSQIIRYFTTEGEPVAIAHRYLRPDGTLGGRGKKPDPKRIFLFDRTLALRQADK